MYLSRQTVNSLTGSKQEVTVYWHRKQTYVNMIEQHKIKLQQILNMQDLHEQDTSMHQPSQQSQLQQQSAQKQVDCYLNLHDPSESSHEQSHHPINVDQPKCYLNLQIDMYLEHPTIHMGLKQTYLAESRQHKIARYLNKKRTRIWNKKIAYACRQKVAQDRVRVKGRFISTKKQQIPIECSKEENFICPPTSASINLKTELAECPDRSNGHPDE